MSRTERLLTVIALVNFFAAIVIALWLGGVAKGVSADGAYLLGTRGRYREVTAFTFWFSLLQTLSVFITHPLAMFAVWRGNQRARWAREPRD